MGGSTLWCMSAPLVIREHDDRYVVAGIIAAVGIGVAGTLYLLLGKHGPTSPIAGQPAINSPYGPRNLLGGTFHYGIDIEAASNTPVLAPESGTILHLLPHNSGNGNEIILRTRSGRIWSFHHLNAFQVALGQKVRKGQQIGLSGNTGDSTGPHLHLGLKASEDANWQDPLPHFPAGTFSNA
jgi:murein DD-endopeptidase MepM/ murein hydrolase activator NlpD